MIKTTTLAVFLFIVFPLFAQDTTKPFYFPHKAGDMWEYRFSEYGEPFSYYDTIQNFTIFDSTDSNGIIHLIQYARQINPIKPPYVLSDTTRYWIDTANSYVYGSSWMGSDSVLIYKLNAGAGEKWVSFKLSNHYEMARVDNKWEESVLGKATSLMRIRYYATQDSADTLGLDRRVDIIADGFGLVIRGGVEATSQEINLRGAVINGNYYGDTTLLSVRNYKNHLPKHIELHQNYPNPFNPSTSITFKLSRRASVSLVIYDMLGEEILKLIESKIFDAGGHGAHWNGQQQNGSNAASGVYFYQLIADQQTLTRSMILLK